MKTFTILRKTLACVLSLLLAIDIAAACRLWSACDACVVASPCEPVAVCGMGTGYGCSACESGCVVDSVAACGGCSSSVTVISGCSACCGEVRHSTSITPTHEPSHHGHVHHEHVHHDHAHHDHAHHEHDGSTQLPEPAPLAPEPTPAAPAPFAEGGFSSAPLIDAPEAVATEEEDIFEAGAPADEPMLDEFDAQEPAEDLTAPEADIAEDLTAPEPADEDLFAEPEPTNEVESAFDEPAIEDDFAAEPMDDEPFGDESMDDAAAEEDLFGDEGFGDEGLGDEGFDSEPMDEPAPADDFSPGSQDFEPEGSEPEVESAAEEELFGFEEEPAAEEPPVEATPFEEPAEEPFDEPFEEPADDFGGFDEDAEGDLFGFDEPAEAAAPSDAMPAEEMPAEDAFDEGFDDDSFDGDSFDDADFGDAFEEPPAEPADAEAEGDLFGDFGMILSEPGGYDSDRPRTWIDNSGRFSCQGNLIAVDGDTLRLQKADGGVARVPLGRLSNADLEFVSRQVAARYDLELLLGGTTVRTAAR